MTERPHHGGWLDVNNIWVVPESTLEAAEADRDRLEKQLEDLENEKAGCCIENEERADRLAARVAELDRRIHERDSDLYKAQDRLHQTTEALREIIAANTYAAPWRDAERIAREALAALAGEDRGVHAPTGDD